MVQEINLKELNPELISFYKDMATATGIQFLQADTLTIELEQDENGKLKSVKQTFSPAIEIIQPENKQD